MTSGVRGACACSLTPWSVAWPRLRPFAAVRPRTSLLPPHNTVLLLLETPSGTGTRAPQGESPVMSTVGSSPPPPPQVVPLLTRVAPRLVTRREEPPPSFLQGGVQGWRACPHAQPGLSHPKGTTSCTRKAAPLTYLRERWAGVERRATGCRLRGARGWALRGCRGCGARSGHGLGGHRSRRRLQTSRRLHHR